MAKHVFDDAVLGAGAASFEAPEQLTRAELARDFMEAFAQGVSESRLLNHGQDVADSAGAMAAIAVAWADALLEALQ